MKDNNICKFIPSSVELGLEITQFIFESNQQVILQEKFLSENNAILIVRGEGKFTFNDSLVDYSAGSIIFGFENEKVSTECLSYTEYMYISFSGMRSEELFKRFGINKHCRIFHGFDGLIPIWKESLSRADNTTIDLAAESMLLYAFSRFSGSLNENNSIINNVFEISENHFTDQGLSIKAIAEELGYNEKYLSHLFKEKNGISYSEYLRNLRIKYAVSLLEHGIDSVKNIALLSGFNDPFYFSTVFKNVMGVSPKNYVSKISKQ